MCKYMPLCLMLIILSTVFLGCAQNNRQPWDYADLTPASPACALPLFSPTKLDEVENHAVHIVQGKFLDGSETDLQYGPDGNAIYGSTISAFQITGVYKGSLAVDQQIKVIEDYHIDKQHGKKIIYSLGSYYPSDVGREYLLFLGEYGPETRFAGQYYAVGSKYGRYPVVSAQSDSTDAASFNNRALNLDEGNSETYRSIYQEVIDNYMRATIQHESKRFKDAAELVAYIRDENALLRAMQKAYPFGLLKSDNGNAVILYTPVTSADAQMTLAEIRLAGSHIYYRCHRAGYVPAGSPDNREIEELKNTLTVGWNYTGNGDAGLKAFADSNAEVVFELQDYPGVYYSEATDSETDKPYGRMIYWVKDGYFFEAYLPAEDFDTILGSTSGAADLVAAEVYYSDAQ